MLIMVLCSNPSDFRKIQHNIAEVITADPATIRINMVYLLRKDPITLLARIFVLVL
jgi:hypothetical protein